MSTIRTDHAVVASTIACDFGACGRRIAALPAYGLRRRLEGRWATGRVRLYRSGSAWFKAWSLRTRRDAQGAVRGFWRIGRCEERGCRADRGFRLTAHVRLKKMDMLTRVPYVCMRSRDILNSSIYLILSSSMDLGASGRLSRAFKTCQNLLPRGLNVRDTTRIRRILCIPMYPGRNPGTPPGYGKNTQDTLRIQYPTKYTQDTLGYIRIRAEYNLKTPRL